MVLPQQGHSLTPSLAASDTLVRLLLNVPAVQVRNLPPFGNRRSNLEPLPLMSACSAAKAGYGARYRTGTI